MALQAQYDLRQDRIRLTLHGADGAAQIFWVTRRQWLGLLRRLRLLAARKGPVVPIGGASAPPRRRPVRDPAWQAIEPVPLDEIRIRTQADGVRLLFVSADRTSGLDLKATGLQQLQEVVLSQAERAGWDPHAALQSLRAGEMARATVARVGRRTRDEGHQG